MALRRRGLLAWGRDEEARRSFAEVVKEEEEEEGREHQGPVVHSGLVRVGAGCSRPLVGEVGTQPGLRVRVEACIGAEVDEGSMPSQVVEEDN